MESNDINTDLKELKMDLEKDKKILKESARSSDKDQIVEPDPDQMKSKMDSKAVTIDLKEGKTIKKELVTDSEEVSVASKEVNEIPKESNKDVKKFKVESKEICTDSQNIMKSMMDSKEASVESKEVNMMKRELVTDSEEISMASKEVNDNPKESNKDVKKFKVESKELCRDSQNIMTDSTEINPHPKNAKSSLTCEICSRTLSAERHLKRHLQNVHKMKSFNIGSMEDHPDSRNVSKKAYRDSDLKCVEWDRTMSIVRHLKRYLQNVHKKNIKDLKSKKDIPESKRKSYSNKKHPKNASPSRTCDKCGKMLSAERHLMRHLQSVHKIQVNMKSKNGSNGFKKATFESKNAKSRLTNSKWGKTISAKQHLKRHLQNVYRNQDSRKKIIGSNIAKFRRACKECGKMLSSQNLQRHKDLVHRKVKKYITCTFPNCDEKFQRHEKRAIHKAKVHGLPTPLATISARTCKECGKTLSATCHLKRHVDHVHKKRKRLMLRCTFPKCTESFTHGRQREVHRVTVHGFPMPYVCHVCQKTFYCNTSLREHKKSHASVLAYPCNKCTSAFAYRPNMVRHIRLVHGDNSKNFSCPYCNQKFSMKGNMLRHAKRRHTDEKDFKCHVCNKAFAEGYELRTHLNMHLGKIFGKCATCQKPFRTQRGLTLHVNREHTKKIILRCSLCPQEFCGQQSLDRHTENIHSQKSLQCMHCDAAFSTYPAYKGHVRRSHFHKPARKVCKTCGMKVFNLQQHVREIHGTAKFKCKNCLAPFSKKKTLRRHIKTKHTNKYHECDTCKKRYLTQEGLEEHTNNTHTNESKFECDLCPFTSGFESGLKIHKIRSHSQQTKAKQKLAKNSGKTQIKLAKKSRKAQMKLAKKSEKLPIVSSPKVAKFNFGKVEITSIVE